MRLKHDYKVTITTMSWKVFDKDRNYREMALEHFRHDRIVQVEYGDILREEDADFSEAVNRLAWWLLGQDRLRRERALPAQAELNDFMGTAGDRVYMVTVNYADKYIEFGWMETLAKSIKEKDWIKKMEYVHEYYTAEGNHPHTHMIMTLNKKMTPRRLAESVFAVKGMKKYCEALNFVQVEKDTSRTWIDRMDYITGNKKESKTENCLRDIEWRQKHFN